MSVEVERANEEARRLAEAQRLEMERRGQQGLTLTKDNYEIKTEDLLKIQVESPVLYDILTRQGYEAYKSAAETTAQNIQAENVSARQRVEAEIAKAPAELQQAYQRGGIDEFNRAVKDYNRTEQTKYEIQSTSAIRSQAEAEQFEKDNIKVGGGQYINRQEFDLIKNAWVKENPEKAVEYTKLIMSEGVDAVKNKIQSDLEAEYNAKVEAANKPKSFKDELKATVENVKKSIISLEILPIKHTAEGKESEAGSSKALGYMPGESRPGAEGKADAAIKDFTESVKETPSAVASFVPFVDTVKNWNDLNDNQKVISLAADVASIAVFVALGKGISVSSRVIRGATKAERLAKESGVAHQVLKVATKTYDDALFSKNITPVKAAKLANNVEAARLKVKTADAKLITQLEAVKGLTAKEIRTVEVNSGLKGLTKTMQDISKAQTELNKANREAAVTAKKFNPNPKTRIGQTLNDLHLQSLAKVQKAQDKLGIALQNSRKILGPGLEKIKQAPLYRRIMQGERGSVGTYNPRYREDMADFYSPSKGRQLPGVESMPSEPAKIKIDWDKALDDAISRKFEPGLAERSGRGESITTSQSGKPTRIKPEPISRVKPTEYQKYIPEQLVSTQGRFGEIMAEYEPIKWQKPKLTTAQKKALEVSPALRNTTRIAIIEQSRALAAGLPALQARQSVKIALANAIAQQQYPVTKLQPVTSLKLSAVEQTMLRQATQIAIKVQPMIVAQPAKSMAISPAKAEAISTATSTAAVVKPATGAAPKEGAATSTKQATATATQAAAQVAAQQAMEVKAAQLTKAQAAQSVKAEQVKKADIKKIEPVKPVDVIRPRDRKRLPLTIPPGKNLLDKRKREYIRQVGAISVINMGKLGRKNPQDVWHVYLRNGERIIVRGAAPQGVRVTADGPGSGYRTAQKIGQGIPPDVHTRFGFMGATIKPSGRPQGVTPRFSPNNIKSVKRGKIYHTKMGGSTLLSRRPLGKHGRHK